MARYWVGGSGNWTDDTNHWATTSGGSPSAGNLPTSSDDVYFDDNSCTTNATVTLNNASCNCKNFTATGLTKSITIYSNSWSYYLKIYGSVVTNGTLYWNMVNGYMQLCSTGNETITTGVGNFTIYASIVGGGKYTFQNNITIRAMSVVSGELDTGNYTVTGGYITAQGTSTLTLGSSTVTLATAIRLYASTCVLSAGTSTVILTDGSGSYGVTSFVNHEFYNFTVTGVASTSFYEKLSITGNLKVTNNCIINGYTGRGHTMLVLDDSVSGNGLHVMATITAVNLTVSNLCFSYVTGAGSASWDMSADTTIHDGGDNSGITFVTPITAYWHEGTGNFTDAKWYTATNGGGSACRVPMVQDTAIFDVNSFDAASSLTFDVKLVGLFDASAVTEDLEIIFDNTLSTCYLVFFNDMLFGSGISVTNGNIVTAYFYGNDCEVDGNGVYFNIVDITKSTDEIIDFTGVLNTINQLQIRNGKAYFNDHSFTFGRFTCTNYGYAYLESCTITVNAINGQVFYGSTAVVCGTSTVNIFPAASTSDVTFAGYGLTLYNLVFGGSTTGYVICGQGYYYNVTVTSFTIEAGTKVKFVPCIHPTDPGGNPQRANITSGTFTLVGGTGDIITITSSTTSQAKLVKSSVGNVNADYCDISYSLVSGQLGIKKVQGVAVASVKQVEGVVKASVKRIMGIPMSGQWIATNSTDSGNNTGWTITS